jgi:hypothetical protein
MPNSAVTLSSVRAHTIVREIVPPPVVGRVQRNDANLKGWRPGKNIQQLSDLMAAPSSGRSIRAVEDRRAGN